LFFVNNYQVEFQSQKLHPIPTEIDFQVINQSSSKCNDPIWEKLLDDI
jgi:hypothetical protein